ncbi:hypothetical protein B0H16DRAFT_1466830 [Mycena metata]|uniref:Uncharacterized protein n=1 Tax=Mycena metata TaxID=1033252 RepID=A0AAD7MYA4_9AGAR|nr:hypothetical protein B0H16DRAFT_1466830 [Mycena metata]
MAASGMSYRASTENRSPVRLRYAEGKVAEAAARRSKKRGFQDLPKDCEILKKHREATAKIQETRFKLWVPGLKLARSVSTLKFRAPVQDFPENWKRFVEGGVRWQEASGGSGPVPASLSQAIPAINGGAHDICFAAGHLQAYRRRNSLTRRAPAGFKWKFLTVTIFLARVQSIVPQNSPHPRGLRVAWVPKSPSRKGFVQIRRSRLTHLPRHNAKPNINANPGALGRCVNLLSAPSTGTRREEGVILLYRGTAASPCLRRKPVGVHSNLSLASLLAPGSSPRTDSPRAYASIDSGPDNPRDYNKMITGGLAQGVRGLAQGSLGLTQLNVSSVAVDLAGERKLVRRVKAKAQGSRLSAQPPSRAAQQPISPNTGHWHGSVDVINPPTTCLAFNTSSLGLGKVQVQTPGVRTPMRQGQVGALPILGSKEGKKEGGGRLILGFGFFLIIHRELHQEARIRFFARSTANPVQFFANLNLPT